MAAKGTKIKKFIDYETTKFLSRLDWPFFWAGGWAEP